MATVDTFFVDYFGMKIRNANRKNSKKSIEKYADLYTFNDGVGI
ncbi:MAG: hypothetical protein ACTSVK_16830 [Promethearchaeota archaeon]